MKAGSAASHYLQRYAVPDLPEPPKGAIPWQHVLVIPAYNEDPHLIDKLAADVLPTALDRQTNTGRALIILVLNRPKSDEETGVNAPLRNACTALPMTSPNLFVLNAHADIYLYDLEQLLGPGPEAQGVGLARKYGCDLALHWHDRGVLLSEWICSSDADAALPKDYFHRLSSVSGEAVAAVYPFEHIPCGDTATNEATALYETWLHYYVLGLEYAHSPYAQHTLGSCLAIKCECYAQVRGFPRRAGGEDFYLLNKAAKIGPIARMEGNCIALESRISKRVPFGTGPAVSKIMDGDTLTLQRLFYHPQCFEALRAWLAVMPQLATLPQAGLLDALTAAPLSRQVAAACRDALFDMGLADAIAHCRKQGKTQAQFQRQFHQWFDGFRTLKFVHALRDAGWSNQSLESLSECDPRLWPEKPGGQQDIEALRGGIRKHWKWTTDQC